MVEVVADGVAAVEPELTWAQAFGREMAKVRKEVGISQTTLAERMGVRQPLVARLERGGRAPEIETVVQVSAAVGRRCEIDVEPDGRLRVIFTKRPPRVLPRRKAQYGTLQVAR